MCINTNADREGKRDKHKDRFELNAPNAVSCREKELVDIQTITSELCASAYQQICPKKSTNAKNEMSE